MRNTGRKKAIIPFWFKQADERMIGDCFFFKDWKAVRGDSWWYKHEIT